MKKKKKKKKDSKSKHVSIIFRHSEAHEAANPSEIFTCNINLMAILQNNTSITDTNTQ